MKKIYLNLDRPILMG